NGTSTTNPSVAQYAKHAADVAYNPAPGVTNSTRTANWETNGYDWNVLQNTNGTFKGYSMGPGYYGKTFYMWPPDPRFHPSANTATPDATNTAKDAGGRWMADGRKRFFYNGETPTRLDGDNSRLWDTSTEQWK